MQEVLSRRYQIRKQLVKEHKDEYFSTRRIEILNHQHQQQAELSHSISQSETEEVRLLEISMVTDGLLPQIRDNNLLGRLIEKFRNHPTMENVRYSLVIMGNVIKDSIVLEEKETIAHLLLEMLNSPAHPDQVLQPSPQQHPVKDKETICDWIAHPSLQSSPGQTLRRLGYLRILAYTANSVIELFSSVSQELSAQLEFTSLKIMLIILEVIVKAEKYPSMYSAEPQTYLIELVEIFNNFISRFFSTNDDSYLEVSYRLNRCIGGMCTVTDLYAQLLEGKSLRVDRSLLAQDRSAPLNTLTTAIFETMALLGKCVPLRSAPFLFESINFLEIIFDGLVNIDCREGLMFLKEYFHVYKQNLETESIKKQVEEVFYSTEERQKKFLRCILENGEVEKWDFWKELLGDYHHHEIFYDFIQKYWRDIIESCIQEIKAGLDNVSTFRFSEKLGTYAEALLEDNQDKTFLINYEGVRGALETAIVFVHGRQDYQEQISQFIHSMGGESLLDDLILRCTEEEEFNGAHRKPKKSNQAREVLFSGSSREAMVQSCLDKEGETNEQTWVKQHVCLKELSVYLKMMIDLEKAITVD